VDVGLIVYGGFQISGEWIKRQPSRHAGKTYIGIIPVKPSRESSVEKGYRK
jgi:hypothetical protein